jgi:hypothetical protein
MYDWNARDPQHTEPQHPFDQLAEDGITAYCEALAEQIAPDDPARQALIVEGLRTLSGRARSAPFDVKTIGRTMIQQMQPGISSVKRFFGSYNTTTKQLQKMWDFFHLAEAALIVDVLPAQRMQEGIIRPTGGVKITTRSGYSVELDQATAIGFNEFLADAYGYQIPLPTAEPKASTKA